MSQSAEAPNFLVCKSWACWAADELTNLDFAELAEHDPVFYSSGQLVKTGSGTVMPVASGEPVSLGDVTVYPGDYIQADSTGAVVIPPMLFDELLRG